MRLASHVRRMRNDIWPRNDNARVSAVRRYCRDYVCEAKTWCWFDGRALYALLIVDMKMVLELVEPISERRTVYRRSWCLLLDFEVLLFALKLTPE